MKQPLLSTREICRLDQIYCDAYNAMLEWRRREPLAAQIHLPKLPELLSVSIAAVVGPKLVGEELLLGFDRHDLQTGSGAGVAVKVPARRSGSASPTSTAPPTGSYGWTTQAAFEPGNRSRCSRSTSPHPSATPRAS